MVTGRGHHAAFISGNAVGGVQLWLHSWSIFRLAIRSAGTRSIITIAIRVHGITAGIATTIAIDAGRTITTRAVMVDGAE
jgi:hypothetical protein